ncbi:tubulin domain-containing protein [Panaeolus papilionaceus]|nr:tubulin domain-containing protein [Panaeolus papilionaceus]
MLCDTQMFNGAELSRNKTPIQQRTTTMKEIVYIQAGNISNYVGTHFWNTQETYLSNTGSKETLDVDPDVSMMDSSHDEKKSTLCPRLLLFDTKSSFGTLSASNALGEPDGEDDNNDVLWSGITQQIKHDRVPKSVYQDRMEREVEKLSSDQELQGVGHVRYWSDFSRVYYLPRSLQKLPDRTELDSGGAEWSQGHELFNRYDEDTELMDGALRLLVESCDNLQGLQISSDSDTFGAFMSSFFVSFRDEYLKIPTFTFAMLPGAILSTTNVKEDEIRKVINEALYLRSLNEFSTMNIPIQAPQEWSQSAWNNFINPDPLSLYQSSAILSTHIESATLPFRLKREHRGIPDLCALLNWRGTGPFGELSGSFPFPSFATARGTITEFSSLSTKPKDQYSRVDVLRGASEQDVLTYHEWAKNSPQTRSSLISGPPYPLPTSFPEMQDSPTSPGFTRAYSALSTSSNLAGAFKNYANVVERSIKNGNAAKAVDMNSDDIKELVNDLWTIHDNMAEVEREL